MPFTTIVPNELVNILEHDEKLIWVGVPSKGIKFRKIDIFLIPFSLIWTSGVLFGVMAATFSGQLMQFNVGSLFALIPIIMLVVGLYFVFGRFIHDSYRRSRINYALTNERVIIRSGSGLQSIYLKSLGTINLKSSRRGRGSIELGDFSSSLFRSNGWGAWSGRPGGPTLEMIDDVDDVYKALMTARRETQATH